MGVGPVVIVIQTFRCCKYRSHFFETHTHAFINVIFLILTPSLALIQTQSCTHYTYDFPRETLQLEVQTPER